MTNPLIVIKNDTRKRQLTTGESEDCTAGLIILEKNQRNETKRFSR